ncbi:sigma-70 family RNA polymerase sigma factor [Actinoplanes sp. NPDC023801]|uniref:RNA polymerase sigma factor n=1 Tax=Actinoplanes sp. NPDC023801 TaxID=3154595 RepID=UPI0033EF73FD
MGRWHPFRSRRSLPAQHEELEFEVFFRARFKAMVRFLIVKEAASLADAEDAVEEAMSAAYTAWSTIENPEAWVRQVALRTLINVRQRDRRRLAVLSALAELLPGGVWEDMGLRAEAASVMELLKKRPPAQREIMAFRVDDFTPGEIAAILGKDPQTVRSNLRAARRAMAAMIEPSQDDPRPGGG